MCTFVNVNVIWMSSAFYHSHMTAFDLNQSTHSCLPHNIHHTYTNTPLHKYTDPQRDTSARDKGNISTSHTAHTNTHTRKMTGPLCLPFQTTIKPKTHNTTRRGASVQSYHSLYTSAYSKTCKLVSPFETGPPLVLLSTLVITPPSIPGVL